MDERHVVTSFLRRTGPTGEDEVLILRRSGRVGTYRRRWAGVSGFLEDRPLEQAYREIEEETGLGRGDVRLVRGGEPLPVPDEQLGVLWVVHPFLFDLVGGATPRLDWEHTEARWIPPRRLRRFRTVPGLVEALARVYPPEAQK